MICPLNGPTCKSSSVITKPPLQRQRHKRCQPFPWEEPARLPLAFCSWYFPLPFLNNRNQRGNFVSQWNIASCVIGFRVHYPGGFYNSVRVNLWVTSSKVTCKFCPELGSSVDFPPSLCKTVFLFLFAHSFQHSFISYTVCGLIDLSEDPRMITYQQANPHHKHLDNPGTESSLHPPSFLLIQRRKLFKNFKDPATFNANLAVQNQLKSLLPFASNHNAEKKSLLFYRDY